MSSAWAFFFNNTVPVVGVCVHRPCMKETENCFSDAQQESSDEDMEWSGNNSMFANLSIPQLDGAADESSGELSYDEMYW